MARKRNIWLETLRNRTTIGWASGALAIYVVYLVLTFLDPEGTRGFSHLRGWVFVGHVFIGTYIANYFLLSGAWNLKKWARMMHFLINIPSFVLFAWLNASIPKYWPAGALIYFNSAITYLGLYGFAGYTLNPFAYYFTLLFLLRLERPEEFANNWPFHVMCCFGIMMYMFYMAYTSGNIRRQNQNVSRLLRGSRRDKRIIADERKKSDGLLLNILPAKIADELKGTGAIEPVHYDSATVMFTDFQGFTAIAEAMTPAELIKELDQCFSYFDSLMDRYNLEKLKTIGDSFMCAGGLPERNNTHAVDCVLAALEIQAFMNQMKDIKAEQGLPYWQLRLGIHSGPLVAGVIGEKKFAYDVWGDTVNTASRLESSGHAGRINISGAVYSLVSDFFDCEFRGRVAAKNKGEIEMYFVQGIKTELSREGLGRVPGDEFRKRYDALAHSR